MTVKAGIDCVINLDSNEADLANSAVVRKEAVDAPNQPRL